jgi:hypothetical protein
MNSIPLLQLMLSFDGLESTFWTLLLEPFAEEGPP